VFSKVGDVFLGVRVKGEAKEAGRSGRREAGRKGKGGKKGKKKRGEGVVRERREGGGIRLGLLKLGCVVFRPTYLWEKTDEGKKEKCSPSGGHRQVLEKKRFK